MSEMLKSKEYSTQMEYPGFARTNENSEQWDALLMWSYACVKDRTKGRGSIALQIKRDIEWHHDNGCVEGPFHVY